MAARIFIYTRECINFMDIYKFTRSASQKEFIQGGESGKSKHNPLEMAFIIFESDHLLSEKHDAYRELLSSYPNMELEASFHNKKGRSLHQCLRAMLVKDECLIERFYADEINATFQAYVYGYMYDGGNWESAFFKTFTELWDDVRAFWERIEVSKEDFYFEIKKTFIGSDEYLFARFNHDGELLAISDYPFIHQAFENEENDPAGFLNDYWDSGAYNNL